VKGLAAGVNVFRLLLVLWAGSLWSLAWVAQTCSARKATGTWRACWPRGFSASRPISARGGAARLAAARRAGDSLGLLAAALLASTNGSEARDGQARAQGSAAGLSFGAWHGVSALLYVLRLPRGAPASVWNEDLR
jgi:hypothetical protein